MKSLQRSFIFIKPYWLTALVAFVSMIVVSLLGLVSPQFVKRIIDDGITPKNMSAIWSGVALLLGAALLRAVFQFLQTYLAERVSQNSAFDMRNRLFNQMTSLSFSYHDQQQTGQLMTRITSDVDIVRMFLGNGLLQLIGSVITLIVAAVVLISMNWQLALIELLSIPIIFVILGFFMARVRPLFGVTQAKLGALNTILQENLAGARVVRAFAREPFETERYSGVNKELQDVSLNVNRRLSVTFPLLFFVVSIATMLVVLVGGNQVINSQMSIGSLVAFNSYLTVLIMPVMAFGFLSAQISRAGISSERIFEVLDTTADIKDKADAKELINVKGRVEFKNVSFKFAGAERNTLTDVSFVAEPGQTVAIIGRTGSGKSSIINLIPRFYDARKGQVLIDDQDVRDVTLDSLRSVIGIVLQDVVLFSGSIRDNIAYGKPSATDEEIFAATKAAQAHDFILAFPDGYNTIIGERGVGLSGGQKQRIAIARTLLLKPSILIFDDSTSSVDAETEYQIQQALDQLMSDCTSFVIAQRLSTVRNADMILLMDDGKLIAKGKHEDLLRESAMYGEILDSQIKK
jgi:ATP-binding cassette subfamily B protein